MPEARIGERITCSCKSLLRVPARDGGKSRVRTLTDWFVETLVYGGGGAILGLGLSLFILSRLPFFQGMRYGWTFIVGFTLTGFLAGLFGGEQGVNWLGRMIRDRETE